MENVSKEPNDEVDPLYRVVEYVNSQMNGEEIDINKVLAGFIDVIMPNRGNEIADCTEAIRFHPNDAILFVLRAIVHENQNNFDMAITDYNEAIRLEPDDPTMYYCRGLAHESNGYVDLAIADYTESLRLDPGSESVQKALAKLKMTRNSTCPQAD